jgi:hypothetical protein
MGFPGNMAVVAHQGGWDELLLFLLPIAVAVVVIRLAESRNRKRGEDASQDEAGSQNKVP